MRSSSKTEGLEDDLTSLLAKINKELARVEGGAEERIQRLETLLRLTSEILASYGANIFTLAMHQVNLIKQLDAIEKTLSEMSRAKTPPLPAARSKAKKDDYN